MQLGRAPSGEQEEEDRSSGSTGTRRVSSARRRASVKSARARSARSKEAKAEPPKPVSPEEQQRRNDVKIRLRNISERDQETLAAICSANGFDQEEDLVNNPGKIEMVSMMFYNTSRISSLQFFPCLKKLQIIQQNLTSLEGLRECTQLEELWVVESAVDRIEFLENCTKLKRLYMYSNRIRRVENLSHLHELEVLSLADNRIFLMENLEHLKELRNLNLANNVISVIGDSLAGLTKLETLNLAGNRIGSFKEVSNLSPYRLPKLKCLFFADPLWGHCPMTSLCNYQTYVLFILQQIDSLDSIFISEEAKQLAEATYMKKKMYYNMRIKTLRRNTSNVVRIANEGKQKTVSSSNQALSALSYALTLVEREMYTLRSNGTGAGDGESPELAELESKRSALVKAQDREYHQVATAEIIFDQAKEVAYGICNTYVRRMVIELETGGNIRLEDGKMSDLWYASCVDLVKSRSFISDFKELGIRGINIVRVTRIHNRCLRQKFEETVHSISNKAETGSAAGGEAVAGNKNERSIEYLFYGEHLGGLEGEMSHVIEDGFRPSAEYASMGLDGAVRLSNSLSVSCYDEVKELLETSRISGLSGRPTCQLIISRVYLGKCTQYTKDKSLPAQALSPGKKAAATGGGVINRHTMPGYDALFKVKQNNPKQRSWYVFDNTLVLPEYVVEFEFEVDQSKFAHPSFMYNYQAEGAESCLNAVSSPEVRSIARPLQFFVDRKYNDQQQRESRKSSFEGEVVDDFSRCDKYQDVLDMPPKIEEQPKAYIMTVEILRRIAAPVGDLTSLTYLNLSANRVRRLENLKHLPSIKTLILSFNQLTRIEGLEEVGGTLETLDLGYNQIRKIEGVNGLVELRTLKLENNLIYRLEDVNVLRKYVPKLENLSLRNNAICDNKHYQSLVLKRLEALKHLDGVSIESFGKQNLALAASCSLTLQLIKENAYNHARLVWLRPDTGGESKAKNREASVSGLGETDFWSEVEELELDHKKIRKIENLGKLSNLKRLSLCDNEITRIEGLDDCYGLEELCLEDNRVQTVENLGQLRNLKKLDLGRNKISCISGFGQTFLSCSLTQLSLEDNEITSLQGIACLKNLLELYIGNNRIVELREVQLLKSFSKLIILDLLGNPLCDDYDYR